MELSGKRTVISRRAQRKCHYMEALSTNQASSGDRESLQRAGQAPARKIDLKLALSL